MTGEVATIQNLLDQGKDDLAAGISNMWQRHNSQRDDWIRQTQETRNYVFATDTTTTSNSSLPWKNKTTLPKLCQIRDNLHANYMAALFPNDDWLRWEAYTQEDDDIQKKEAIQAYMANKLRLFNFKEVISQLVYDYIDYGNVFADVEYQKVFRYDENTEQEEVAKEGPVAIRYSPYQIVFNPTAPSFEESYHIIRTLRNIGELEKDIKELPDDTWRKDALERMKAFRSQFADFKSEDINEAASINIDGFGSYAEYLQSDYVELLEFRGNYYDINNEEYYDNYVITILDGRWVLRNEPLDNYLGRSTAVHGRWRYRPGNLYGMGPLDNLVGMQYRIDHLENIKADMFDLIAHPPIKIKGQVEDFEWGPLERIFMGEDGDVESLQIDGTALQADTYIAILEQKMEEFAGAPKQAIGMRTPGEKTAFEVNVLEQNSNKMFQEKVTDFEINVVEPLLNSMLEVAKRELDGSDLVGVMDDDLGVQSFLRVTPKDLKAKGKIRPIGARHFARRAQLVQNYQGMRALFAQDPGVMNHISGVQEAKLLEDLLALDRFDLVRPNIRIEEQAESLRLAQTLQQQGQEEAAIPSDEDEAAVEQELFDAEEGSI